jgi:hypothetical protein
MIAISMAYEDGGLISGVPGLHRMGEGAEPLPSSYVGHLTNMVNGRARVPLAACLGM